MDVAADKGFSVRSARRMDGLNGPGVPGVPGVGGTESAKVAKEAWRGKLGILNGGSCRTKVAPGASVGRLVTGEVAGVISKVEVEAGG